ncbi:MAG: tetratricopeptide repeat protein, partial [Desulfobacula sp.]
DAKDFDSAFKICNDRLKKNDREAFTYNLLGSVHMIKKELDKAQAAFEKAVEIQPDWGKPYDNLARVYLLRGEKDSAIKKFNDALQKDPGNTATWMLLGSLYENDKAYDKAANNYQQAFEKNPGMWAAANNYAFIMSELAKDKDGLQKAMDVAIKAERLNPGAGIIQDTIGWINFKMGNVDQAHAAVLKALAQHPDQNVLNYHMGMILDAQGKTQEAKLYLEKSLVSDNNFLGAENAKKLLEKYNADK